MGMILEASATLQNWCCVARAGCHPSLMTLQSVAFLGHSCLPVRKSNSRRSPKFRRFRCGPWRAETKRNSFSHVRSLAARALFPCITGEPPDTSRNLGRRSWAVFPNPFRTGQSAGVRNAMERAFGGTDFARPPGGCHDPRRPTRDAEKNGFLAHIERKLRRSPHSSWRCFSPCFRITALPFRLNRNAPTGISIARGANDSYEFAAKHRHGLAGNPHAVVHAPRAHESPARRGLVSDEIVAS
jgi:hypothetical protein